MGQDLEAQVRGAAMPISSLGSRVDQLELLLAGRLPDLRPSDRAPIDHAVSRLKVNINHLAFNRRIAVPRLVALLICFSTKYWRL